MDLSGFAAFDFTRGIPYFSITENGITFNKGVTTRLACPAYVRFLINKETRQVALQVCEENTPKAVQFYKPNKKDLYSVRWNSQDLLTTLKKLLGSNLEHGFRVDGRLVEDGLMLFDLNEAKPLD